MRYAAFDIRGVWLFDFLSDAEEREQVLREAQEEDPEVYRVEETGEDS